MENTFNGTKGKWIIEKLTELCPKDVRYDIDNNVNLHEENYLRLNCNKAKSRLSWMPKLNLEQGLEWIIEWYMQYEQNNNIRNITEQQIEKFQKLP